MLTHTHGTNTDCPLVQSGYWTRCLGHYEGDVYPLTAEEMEHRLNTDDLYAEIQDLYSDGEGQLRTTQMEKLVDYIIRELTTPICKYCGFQEYPLRPHGDFGCPGTT